MNLSSLGLTLFRNGHDERSAVHFKLAHVSLMHTEILCKIQLLRVKEQGNIRVLFIRFPCELRHRTGTKRSEKKREAMKAWIFFLPNPL